MINYTIFINFIKLKTLKNIFSIQDNKQYKNSIFCAFLAKKYFFIKYFYISKFNIIYLIQKDLTKNVNKTKITVSSIIKKKKTVNLYNLRNQNKFNLYKITIQFFNSFLFVNSKKFKNSVLVVNKKLILFDYFKDNYWMYKIIYKIQYFNKKSINKYNNILWNDSHEFRLNFFIKYIINNNDINSKIYTNEKINLMFLSNSFLINNYNLLYVTNFSWEKRNFVKNFLNKKLTLNNYYPVLFSNKRIYSFFFNKFKFNYNLNYIIFNNKLILNFIEFFSKKKVSITVSNNYFNKLNNPFLLSLLNEYNYFKPVFFKNSSVLNFIEVIWYSFLLKDLNIISDWISKFMEGLNFKNHKRFVMFFQNFINKNSGVFINTLGIKGFFFDIRGKVGVTGSSKKRHFFVKFGRLNKSSKNQKIDFNQNLVRSYSGVMGVTYIICY